MTFLVACNRELFDIEKQVPAETNGIKINLSIDRQDSFGSTKATVKSAWADEDVIFVFFKGVAAPKYLEMKYDSSSDTWIPTAKNGLTSSDLSDAADKKMTAIYLPYGSTATVAASEGNFIFSDITYSGYFLKAELVAYTYDGDVLSGTLNMTALALSSGSDKLIHFDISGFTSGHNYKLYQDYVKPLTFTNVSADGVISTNEGSMGAAITGYEDGSMMSFSGILDASAVGNAVDYQFSIDDVTSGVFYIRDAGIKTVSTPKYIGIGAINNSSVWNAFEYIDLGLSVKWATFNVGASTPEGYGDYYAWGEVASKDYYDWSTYNLCMGSSNTLTKYNTDGNYGAVDNKVFLDIEDDVAHVMWGGSWRMPTRAEMDELINNCIWSWTTVNGVRGQRFTSIKSGYEECSIFLPAAGYHHGEIVANAESYGYYWSSSLNTGSSLSASRAEFYSSNVIRGNYFRYEGFSVRPVCPLDMSVSMFTDEKKLLVDANAMLNVVVKQYGEVIEELVTWSSDNPSVAVVDRNGIVTGKSAGIAHITASTRSSSAQCTVTVVETSDIEPEYVDLGLSVNWATFNVGALSPEDYGAYYALGEIETKSTYNWSTYRWCNGSSNTLTKYCSETDNGYDGFVDYKTALEDADDVAHVKWGSSWRMPTKAEQEELRTNCTWAWTTVNGVNGYRVTSKKPGYTDRSIFLPAAGYRYGTVLSDVGSRGRYWSSSINNMGYSSNAWNLEIGSSYYNVFGANRYYGLSVRPVCP